MLNLKANVGRRPHRHCMNLETDQITVTTLLNAIPEMLGGTAGKLSFKVLRGICPDPLYQAILTFQRKNTAMADGIVEPGGPAIIFMNKLADAHMPLNLVGPGGAAIYQNTATDLRIDAWKQVPQKYKGPTDEQRAKTAWEKLEAGLRRDQAKTMWVKAALRFLAEQKKLYGTNAGLGAWARAFGHAFVLWPKNKDWEEKLIMDGDVLLFNGDRSVVKVSNLGLTDDPPVLLFGDLTYYVMKKTEIVDVTYKG